MKESKRNLGNDQALRLLNEGWQIRKLGWRGFWAKGYDKEGEAIIIVHAVSYPIDKMPTPKGQLVLEELRTPHLKYLLEGDNWIAERFMDEKRQAEHKREDGERIDRERKVRDITSFNSQFVTHGPLISDPCTMARPADVEDGWVLVKVKEGSKIIPPEELAETNNVSGDERAYQGNLGDSRTLDKELEIISDIPVEVGQNILKENRSINDATNIAEPYTDNVNELMRILETKKEISIFSLQVAKEILIRLAEVKAGFVTIPTETSLIIKLR